MNSRALRWIVILMSLALTGLVVFQIYWIDNVLNANKDRFQSDVHGALNNVASKIEKQEALHVAYDNLDTRFQLRSATSVREDTIELLESTFKKRLISIESIGEDSLKDMILLDFAYDFETSDIRESFNLHDNQIKQDTRKPDRKIGKEIKEISKHLDSTKIELQQFEGTLRRVVKKSEMVNVVIHELLAGKKNIQNRIDKEQLDSLLSVEFQNKGIDISYNFGVINKDKDSIIFAFSGSDISQLKGSDLRASLFSNDILHENNYLHVYFPEEDRFLVGKVWITLGSSFVFMLVIIFCFTYAILTIIQQKKISQIKNDFINNMTHEFKTPIATVSLACEALQDDQINTSAGMKERYMKVITDENKRLGLQVEKVLQMATLDKQDFKLKVDKVNIHDIIDKVLENTDLQVQKRGGVVHKELNAEYLVVEADEMHLTNIFYNLLDNANKYSSESPEITIRTKSSARGVFINIIDQGIGMSRDAVNKIFEKFYRVPTGNLHDVKGFGLGLAYVKSMIEAHGGSILVKSEPKSGSNFEIYLPFEYGKA